MKHSSKKGLKQKDLTKIAGSSSSNFVSGNSSSFKGKESRLSKVPLAPDTPEECTLSFPDLRIVDNSKLPCYLTSMY